MIVFTPELIKRESQKIREPLRSLVSAINDAVHVGQSYDELIAVAMKGGFHTLITQNKSIDERLTKMLDDANIIETKTKELYNKTIDDSNIRQVRSGTERVIFIAAHAIGDSLFFIKNTKKAIPDNDFIKDIELKLKKLRPWLDDFNSLLSINIDNSAQLYQEVVEKDITFSQYMEALEQSPRELSFLVENGQLEALIEEATAHEDYSAYGREGASDGDLFNWAYRYCIDSIEHAILAHLSKAALDAFEEDTARFALISEILPAFASEICQIDNDNGIAPLFEDVYLELTRK